ncbi:MAG: rRNA methyltransferase [Chitinophagaceae bacterium]|nr:rRNA methyltransferase [Chitinophagaceae bacterium]
MGATKWVSVQRFTPTPTDNATAQSIYALREKGYKIVATSPHHKTVTPANIPIDQPLALFFGNEKEGLSDYVIQHADHYMYLPMYGFTESLNISVSAAMIMKALYERITLEEEKITWQLTDEDKNELRLDWLRKSLKKSDYIIDDYYKNHRH